jgi:8-oxo-dGTP pyrophosphatase MutT (NUDIX family)
VPPALVLFFLAPAVGELLSGSSPPAEYFQPLTFLLLSALYGSGAVMARELTFRWGKGWPSLVALGAAYGILEEGLAVKSFFDPGWVDLGPLGVYGRWAGVNWVWSLELTVYHAVFSITVPVVLTGLLFPDRRAQRWTGRHALWWFYGLIAAVTLLCYSALTPYRPPTSLYVAAFLAAAGLVALARRLPRGGPWWGGAPGPEPRPVGARWFAAVAFAGTALFFAAAWALPQTTVPPVGAMLLMAGAVLGAGRLAVRLFRRGGDFDRRLWALVSGALGFFILLAPLQELDPARPDDTSGMTLVAVGTAALLGFVARKRGFHRPEPPPGPRGGPGPGRRPPRTQLYIVNVEAAVFSGDRWLVIKRSEEEEHAPGTLSLVGGKVEGAAETPSILEKTLVREVLEEVGIEVEDELVYLESKTFLTDKGEPVVDVVFVCERKGGEARCADLEVDAVYWMTAEEVMGHEKAPGYLKDTIRAAETVRLRLSRRGG